MLQTGGQSPHLAALLFDLHSVFEVFFVFKFAELV